MEFHEIPKLFFYPVLQQTLFDKQNNPDYAPISQQTRQNIINIQDIIQNNQIASNLTLPTPISQRTIPRYQANSPQNSYKMVA